LEATFWPVRLHLATRENIALKIIHFKILGEIAGIETIARSGGIRELKRLRKTYGTGNWRKRKGIAQVRLADGTIVNGEVHWYEAHGRGKKEVKLKRIWSD
jgi:hypothetical protein